MGKLCWRVCLVDEYASPDLLSKQVSATGSGCGREAWLQ